MGMFASSETGLMACPIFKEGAHGFREGTRFLREPNIGLLPYAYSLSFIVESYYINELYVNLRLSMMLSWV